MRRHTFGERIVDDIPWVRLGLVDAEATHAGPGSTAGGGPSSGSATAGLACSAAAPPRRARHSSGVAEVGRGCSCRDTIRDTNDSRLEQVRWTPADYP